MLENLSEADPATIVSNVKLIESLEDTKNASVEIAKQQAIAKETEITIKKSHGNFARWQSADEPHNEETIAILFLLNLHALRKSLFYHRRVQPGWK